MHALVGQNGSGKSTLIKVLAGYHQPDDGRQRVGERRAADARRRPRCGRRRDPLRAPGPRAGRLDERGREPRPHCRLPDGRSAAGSTGATRSAAPARRSPCWDSSDVDVKAPINDLPPSQRTAVAIARALVGWEDGASLLVLDEPTATLPGDDVDRLFEVIHRLKERGVSILYVSHHLDEVFELADRVTVLRDGKLVATVPVSRARSPGSRGADRRTRIETTTRHRGDRRAAQPLLTVRGLRGGTVHGIDLDVYAGEIVGLAGITGSGREHVLALIAGQIPRDDGDVRARRHPDRQLPAAPGDRGRRRLRAGRARRARHGRAR